MTEQKDLVTRHPRWLSYATFMRKFDWAIILLSLISFAVCIHYVRNIKVKSDFKEMLPEQYRSVTEYNKLEKRTRSTGSLVVLVGNAPWKAMKSFIDDFTAKAKEELKDDVSEIEFSAKKSGDFFDKNKFLFIDLEDLQEAHDRLARQIDYEKLSKTGLYLNFEDEKPKFTIEDIEDKYRSKTGNYLNYKESYFTTKEADLAAVILKPVAGASNVEFAERLIEKCRKIMTDLNPSKYDPNLKFGFGGRYQKMITEYKSLIGDIFKTTILCLVLVGAVVFLYYRRIKVCMLVTITVAQGVLVALAIGYLTIGYLTTQTAFLGSIIVGNGINYSLILLARYLEERRDRGHGVTNAIAVSLSQTWKPTLVAATTTSASFAILMLTKVKGFSQFGFIGSIGMVVCWLCTYFFLPSWLSLFERIWVTKVAPDHKPQKYWFFERLANLTVGRYRMVLKTSAIVSFLSVALIAWYIPNSLEYNFENMRFKPPKETGEKWELEARNRVSEIFSMSTTPAVVLTDRPDQATPVCDVIRERSGPKGDSNLLDDCKTLDSLVPKNQKEKLKILKDMRVMLSDSSLDFLNEEQKKEVEKFRGNLDLREIVIGDLPKNIVMNFEEVDGSLGKIAYVYPKPTANLWNGKELIRFADLIREVDLPNGEKIYSSGESVIFADLLDAVVHDGPFATILSFIAVLIVIVINFKGAKESAIIMFALAVGILWLVASLPIANIKLNFLNFIALPISFGIGVDYAVNIYQRYKQDGRGSIEHVLKHTGGAVMLCSLTTIIGYSVILTSRSMGLVSFGMVALLGEFTCLAAAIITLPSFITWLEKRR